MFPFLSATRLDPIIGNGVVVPVLPLHEMHHDAAGRAWMDKKRPGCSGHQDGAPHPVMLSTSLKKPAAPGRSFTMILMWSMPRTMLPLL